MLLCGPGTHASSSVTRLDVYQRSPEKAEAPAVHVVPFACDPSPSGTDRDIVVDRGRLFPPRDDVSRFVTVATSVKRQPCGSWRDGDFET
jgi:hypothetical protein